MDNSGGMRTPFFLVLSPLFFFFFLQGGSENFANPDLKFNHNEKESKLACFDIRSV